MTKFRRSHHYGRVAKFFPMRRELKDCIALRAVVGPSITVAKFFPYEEGTESLILPLADG